MTPLLAAPLALAALASLAIPLLIHLARRTETAPVDFAALRWLSERPRPRRRWRWDERALLAARLLLLALAALWLAHPLLVGAPDTRPRVAVVPGVDPGGAGEGALWLAPGFPPIDCTPGERCPAPPATAVFSLVRELDAVLPPGTPLTVRVPAVIEDADGERPRLSRPVRWLIAPGRMTAPAGPAAAPIHLAVRDGGISGTRYLVAAAAALGAPGDIAGADKPLPIAGALAWFVPGPLPAPVRAWAARGNTVLLPSTAALPDAITVMRDAQGAPVASAVVLGRGRLIRFARPLIPAQLPALVEPDFPERLRALLAPPAEPHRADARDLAPVLDRAIVPDPGEAPVDARPWLGVLIALAFLAERWLATARRRR